MATLPRSRSRSIKTPKKGKNKIHSIHRNLKSLVMVNKGRVVLLRKLFFFLWDQSRQSCSRSQSEYRIFFILPTHRFNHVVNLLSSSDWLELLIAFESCDWPEKFLYLFLFCGTNKKHLQKLWLNL